MYQRDLEALLITMIHICSFMVKDNGTTMLNFICTHRLQPLYWAVYGPDADYPWITMTIYDIPGIAALAFPHASNIMAGFKVAGISPFNRDTFQEDDYDSAFTTDRPM